MTKGRKTGAARPAGFDATSPQTAPPAPTRRLRYCASAASVIAPGIALAISAWIRAASSCAAPPERLATAALAAADAASASLSVTSPPLPEPQPARRTGRSKRVEHFIEGVIGRNA